MIEFEPPVLQIFRPSTPPLFHIRAAGAPKILASCSSSGSGAVEYPAQSGQNTSRKRPARIPGLTASNAGYLIPEAIRKKFADGWKTHVPLQYLTDTYYSFTNQSSKELNDSFTMDGSVGTIISVAKELPIDGELHLTFDEWFQAWNRLLELIQQYFPEDHDAWKAHFRSLRDRPNRAQNWSLCLEYDSQIRRRALNVPLDPAILHLEIWNELESVHIGKRAITFVRRELNSNTNGGRGARPPNNSDREQGAGKGRFLPYNSSDRPSSDPTNSFRPNNGKTRCFVCGSSDPSHKARSCTADRLVTGKPTILIVQYRGGPRKDRNGFVYCFTFNGHRGCPRGVDCEQGKHWCSLCGAKSGLHTAQNCVSI
ncbi:hypothetical protein B0H19DRAFT_1079022 [Mycena capillaripes]|nr:hypothetical protein B0H19DRAFT_1079022 [Mycena capillaripes]